MQIAISLADNNLWVDIWARVQRLLARCPETEAGFSTLWLMEALNLFDPSQRRENNKKDLWLLFPLWLLVQHLSVNVDGICWTT